MQAGVQRVRGQACGFASGGGGMGSVSKFLVYYDYAAPCDVLVV